MVCVICVLGAGCGKKGAPLPPLQRLPTAPADFGVTRIEDDVYVRLTVPTANVDGVSPADVARVDVYAVTADREPPATLDRRALRELSTLVATEAVRRPLPPPPPVKEGLPPIPLPPPGPGVDQGAAVVVREVLSPQTRTPVEYPDDERRPREDEEAVVVGPLVPPPDEGLRRFYYAVAVNSRGRDGPPTAFVPAPLGPTSSAPSAPEIVVEERSVTIRWTPAADARGVVEPTPEGLLPSTPVVAGPPPTTYDVYEVPRNGSPGGPTTAQPTPLTPAPIGAREFTQADITLGTERCFMVRPVDIISGHHVRGPASPVVCASFADTFPPASPGRLDAVATAGVISLIWEPADSADLAGYLVLRGEAGSATLTPLTADPVIPTTYRDEAVQPGARYVYAVVAVDKAGNRSGESNRVEETARQ